MTHEQAHRDAITAFGWEPAQWFPLASDRGAQSKKLYADELLLRAVTIAYPAWKTRRKEASELKRSNAERALLERSTTATVALLELGDASWHEVDIQLDVSPAYEEDEPPRPQPGTAPNNPTTAFATMRASIRTALQGTMEETFTHNTPRRAHQHNPRKKVTTANQDTSSELTVRPNPEHYIPPSQRSFTATQPDVARTADRQAAGSLVSLALHQGPTELVTVPAATTDISNDHSHPLEEAANRDSDTMQIPAAAPPKNNRRLDESDQDSLTTKQKFRLEQALKKKARTEDLALSDHHCAPNTCNYPN
jgi:hypothetical protein